MRKNEDGGIPARVVNRRTSSPSVHSSTGSRLSGRAWREAMHQRAIQLVANGQHTISMGNSRLLRWSSMTAARGSLGQHQADAPAVIVMFIS